MDSLLNDKIIIDNREYIFNVIDYYDGNKEEVNIDLKTLLLWYNHYDEYEEWYIIKAPYKDILVEYLENKISLEELMKNSNICIGRRYYYKYEELIITNEKVNLNDTSRELPF